MGHLPATEDGRLLDGRTLTRGDLRLLFAVRAEVPGPGAMRDVMVAAVHHRAGLWRTETEVLALSDYDLDSGSMMVRAGKGGKGPVRYLDRGATQMMFFLMRG